MTEQAFKQTTNVSFPPPPPPPPKEIDGKLLSLIDLGKETHTYRLIHAINFAIIFYKIIPCRQ